MDLKKSYKVKTRIIVFEVFNINSVKFILTKIIFRRFKSNIEFYFFDYTKAGLLMSKLFFFFGYNPPKKLEFEFDTFTDENESNLGWSSLYFDLSEFLNLVTTDNTFINDVKSISNDSYYYSFLLKNIMSSGSTGENYDKINTHLNLFKVKVVSIIFNNYKEVTFYSEKLYFRNLFLLFAEKNNVKVDFIKSYDYKYYFLLLLQKFKIRIKKFVIIFLKKPKSEKKVIVIDTVISKYNSKDIWSKLSGGENNLLFLMRNHPISENYKNKMINNGSAFISVDSIPMSKKLKIPLHFYDNKNTNSINCVSNHSNSYLKKTYIDFQKRKNYWKEIFNNYGSKFFLSSHKYNPDYIAANAAINDLDGFSMMFQEAYNEFPTPEGIIHTDVFFCFSPLVSKVEKLSKSKVKYYVSIGYIGDYRFDTAKKNSESIRKKLYLNGAKIIISYLDESAVDDSRWGPAYEGMRNNYKFLLQKLLDNDWLGIILKPKKPNNLKKVLGNLSQLLDKAIDTGRLFIFDKELIYNPCDAAYASDIAIHDYLIAGTAGIECALTGTSTVFIDTNGWGRSRLNRLGLNKSVFISLPALWDILFKNYDDKFSNKNSWSKIINEIDPFRDGNAINRAVDYINCIIDGHNKGLSNNDALLFASEKYRNKWGDKFVYFNNN